MLKLQSHALLALSACYAATAAPTGSCSPPSGGQCPSTYVNANFDDITPSPVVAITAVPTPYKGLFYQAFQFARPGVPVDLPTTIPGTTLLPGFVAHSPPNVAFTNPRNQVTAGTPMLTVNYPNSNTRSFDLESFYFACDISLANNVAAPLEECYITVTGYQTAASDNQVSAATQVCSQQFIYNPSTRTGQQQMAFSGPVKSCFKDLQFAIMQTSPEGGEAVAASDLTTAIDDVKYSYRNKTCPGSC